MTPTLLVLAAVALGAVTGGALTATVVATRRASRRRSAQMRPALPEIATSILHEIDAFAVILDASLSPVYANPTALEEQTMGGEQLTDPEFLAQARRVMNTGIPYTRQPDPADSADSIRMHIVRVPPRFLVVLADDLGEEQRVNAMRRDFIANVSHELKTPIAAIGLLAEAIQEAADEPETVQSFAKSLARESRRLGELSRDVIRLSEAQSALIPEEREQVNLYEVVRAEVDQHRTYAEQRGVELAFTEPSEAAASAITLGKPAALGIAISNLLTNAIQFSPAGAHVGIGMEAEKRHLTITVTDQGPGIEPEHLPRIFERFYRVDSSRSRDGGGTGLGLSITRHTLRAHGGDVDVWSQPGLGSTFTVTIPIISSADPEKKLKKRMRKVQKMQMQNNRAVMKGSSDA